MIATCKNCGVRNNVAEPLKANGQYRCGTCKSTLTVNVVNVKLEPGELTFPGVCGRDERPIAFVARERLRGVLEVIRAIALPPISQATDGQPMTSTPTDVATEKPAGHFARRIN